MSKQMLELAEELREYTAMKYAGDCKCGKCQLVPRRLVERIYHALNSTAIRSSAESEAETLLRRIATSSYSEGTMHDAIRAAKDYVGRRPPTEPQTASAREAILMQALETAAGRFNMMAGVGLVNGADPKVGYRECMDALKSVRSQAESAPGREALWHTIAKHIACKKDCQARPSGCGCARDAANTIIRAMTAISPQHQGASNE